MRKLFVAASVSIGLIVAAPALAQPTALDTKLAQFEQVTVQDLQATVKIFEAAKNTNGLTCAQAWLALAQANATVDATQLPKFHLFATFAKLYNIHLAFQGGSPVRTACAAMKDDILGSGGGILGGAALVKKLLPAMGLLGI